MSFSENFLIALQACQEIQAELQEKAGEKPSEPTGIRLEGFPPGMLLLGLDENSQPLLLDLYDPEQGPLLVAGDAGSGKTALLQSLAHTSDDLVDVQFGVLTSFPEEWESQAAMAGCLGVWPAYHPSAGDFLKRLISWADVLAGTRQVILLLVDGLELNALEPPVRHYLRWLLVHGAQAQIRAVVSVNAGRLSRLGCLQGCFPLRILGSVRREQTRRLLGDEPGLDLAGLPPGEQFYLCGQQRCTRFWLPPLGGE